MPRNKRPEGEGRLIQLVYYGYVAGSAVARWLPEGWSYGIAQRLGAWGAKRSKKREQVARNLARITGRPAESPEVQDLVVEAYRSYARYWLETFALVREDKDFFLDRFRSADYPRLRRTLEEHGGVIVVVGHLGNWDAAGAWVGANGHLLVTVAEVLKPRRMFDFFVDHRAKLGMRIHAARAGVTRTLAEEVNNGAILAILGDRDLKGTGPEVTFFGDKANFPAGPASLAIETGKPLMVAGVFSKVHGDGKRGWEAIISEAIEVPAGAGKEAIPSLTQTVAEHLERFVAMHPEEWHVFQPFWKDDRDAARAARDADRGSSQSASSEGPS